MTSPRTGPKKVGKYEILEVIGRGGMGVVYKATDPEIGRLVGIKMMTSAIINDPDLLKRFYREAQASGRLQHPNIITIYDLGVHDGTPYLVMEFLEGENLDLTIKVRRPMSIEDKLGIGIQLCNGLAYAHERNIVHRDIKPGNVMLLKDGTVKIVDFGIARAGGDRVTRTGQVMGSVQYMSPEQINGAHVDQRTDIFSVGALLYQLLTHALPFEGKDTGDTLLKIIHGTPPPLNQFLPVYPRELENILLKALAKNPEERYQTATELGLDLSHVQDGLKHERVSEYLQTAEAYISESHWTKAQEQLLQVLKIDRQNARSATLLRTVQQEIQKQQRSEHAKDLRSQADQALAKGDLDDALRYLGMAVDLVPNDTELVQIRDSLKEKKATVDRLNEWLRLAESAHDGGELEEALAATEEALALDPENTEAMALHAVITRELAERAKLKQVQSFIDEARKQISSRRFTAALEVLKKAESLDPAATGIIELISLASTGQQQERRRKELEQITANVQEALNRSDHLAACERAAEALRKFPDDRALAKLKALADKEREAYEKRTYIETRVSTARRLLEEHRSQEALPSLEEALARYPGEFVLVTMHAFVTESIEREQTEQFKTQAIQQAKEAIRRKAYDEAIDVLRAAQQKSPSSEFEDLLQFAADEAAAHEKQLVIDAAAQEAHRLISADEFESAIALLEQTLKKLDDQELRIILADAQSQLERFDCGVQEAINAAQRLRHSQRFSEAVKLMEGQLETYRKSPQFCNALEDLRGEEQRVHAFSTVKEQVREAVADSNYDGALALLEAFQHQFGAIQDAQLLRNEIEVKRGKAATLLLERALTDARILLLVNSYTTALGVLDRVASDVGRVAPEIRDKYRVLRTKAETLLERDRQTREQHRLRQIEMAERISDQPTLDQSHFEQAVMADDQGTQKATPADLERLLGEVTLVGQHYPEDANIENKISDLRHKLTAHIAELRQTEIPADATLEAGLPIEKTTQISVTGCITQLQHEARGDSQPTQVSEQEQVLEKTLVADLVEPAETETEVAPALHEPLEVVAPISNVFPIAAQSTLEPSLTQRSFDVDRAELAESEETVAVREEDSGKAKEETELSRGAEIAYAEQPTLISDERATPEPMAEVTKTLGFPTSQPDAIPPRISTSPIPAEVVPHGPVLVKPGQVAWNATTLIRAQSEHEPPRVLRTADSRLRSIRLARAIRKTPAITAAVAIIVAAAIWIILHAVTSPKKESSVSTPAVVTPAVNPIEIQQRQAISDSNKQVAAGDLEGAQQTLQQAATLAGPLSSEIQKRLADIHAALTNEELGRLRQQEEQLWQEAESDIAEARFTAAQKKLHQILDLPEGGTRKPEAQVYLNETIPKRKGEESLFNQAKQAAQTNDPASLQNAEGLLGQVIAEHGPRKAEATQLRAKVHDQLAALKQQREQQIATLLARAHQAVGQGDIHGARQRAEEINRLGGDTTALSGEIDQAERTQQARASAEATYQQIVQRYHSAWSANDKQQLESVKGDLLAIAQGAGPHAVEAQNYADEINRKLVALNQPPAHPPAKVPGSLLSDSETVRSLVQRYAKAFEDRDADALRQIWPSMAPSMYSSYKENFGNARSIHMKVNLKTIEIGPEGRSAMVVALVTQKYTPKGFAARNTTDTALFRFAKRGDAWLIIDVR